MSIKDYVNVEIEVGSTPDNLQTNNRGYYPKKGNKIVFIDRGNDKFCLNQVYVEGFLAIPKGWVGKNFKLADKNTSPKPPPEAGKNAKDWLYGRVKLLGERFDVWFVESHETDDDVYASSDIKTKIQCLTRLSGNLGSANGGYRGGGNN